MNDEATAGLGFNGSDLLTTHYPLIARLVRSVARRHRLSVDEAEDLRSQVHLKLVEDDFSVLRRFEGRSTLATYLTRVIWRVCLDRRSAAWGRWRPSAQARRQGQTALILERLLYRDGVPFDEACARLLGSRGVTESREELERMRDSFPTRQRVRIYGQDVLDALPSAAVPAFSPSQEAEQARAGRGRRAALASALGSLPRDDRHLLRLRYRDGWTIARVARQLRLDPRRAYREFDRVHKTLRRALSGRHVASDPQSVDRSRLAS
jgi:RNA polymerase sigma factor (sigma-70 family)